MSIILESKVKNSHGENPRVHSHAFQIYPENPGDHSHAFLLCQTNLPVQNLPVQNTQVHNHAFQIYPDKNFLLFIIQNTKV